MSINDSFIRTLQNCAIIFLFALSFIQIQIVQLSSYLHCTLFKVVEKIKHFADNGNMRTELFYERLERLLKDKNMQQKELADICGISSNGISTWKATGSYPRADIAVKLAAVLGVTVEYLITGELPGIDNTDKLAYDVSVLPENKRKVIQAVIDSLSAFD